MNRMRSRAALCLACAAALTCCSACFPPRDDAAQRNRFYVSRAASGLVDQDLAAVAPTGSEAAAFEKVPSPGVQFQANEARATSAPWIDSNAWRFQRGIQKAHYAKLPAGSAPLAAAEAFTYNVDAILSPDPGDVDDLGRMLQFLNAQDQAPLPALANIGVVDDRSPMMGEVMNLLTRRNLLYRVVPSADRELDLTVQLGTEDFPTEAAADPSEFAARVRAKLGDDNRLVRLYGASTVIAHLTGDDEHARLYLLAYGRNRPQGGSQQFLRIRLLGRYQPDGLAAYGAAPDAELTDIEHPGNTTEFWVPAFNVVATIDLRQP